jgi:para-aminobenzoate synthetase / 4-amino-4-deoxychorismate lyase
MHRQLRRRLKRDPPAAGRRRSSGCPRREGTTDADLVRAAFPPGSVTGAPKIQALEVIAALEGSQREGYTGAIGFASPHAGLELSVAIRTLEVAGERAWLGCGGGIVADSDPQAELREALGKAAPIARALGASVPSPVAATPPAAPPPWPHRPDPARGLLETLAVRDGVPVEADRHLARVRASARELYGLDPRVELPAAPPDGRLRVLLTPDGRTTVEAHAEPATATEVALEPRALAGGLGAHKWLDRPQDPAPAARAGDPAHLLDQARHPAGLLGVGGPSSRARELAAELREHPAISRKTRSYIR